MQLVLFPEIVGADKVALCDYAEERTVQEQEERSISIDAVLARYQLSFFSPDVLQALCS